MLGAFYLKITSYYGNQPLSLRHVIAGPHLCKCLDKAMCVFCHVPVSQEVVISCASNCLHFVKIPLCHVALGIIFILQQSPFRESHETICILNNGKLSSNCSKCWCAD